MKLLGVRLYTLTAPGKRRCALAATCCAGYDDGLQIKQRILVRLLSLLKSAFYDRLRCAAMLAACCRSTGDWELVAPESIGEPYTVCRAMSAYGTRACLLS
jgi:hypothetical protein